MNSQPATAPRPALLTPRQRWISLIEALIGTALVIGHNVYHVLPNEVPLLFIIGWVSVRIRNGGWKNAGLKRPASWPWTVLLAVLIAALLQLDSLVIDPLSKIIWHQAPDISEFNSLRGNVKQALLSLGLIWTFAAFGEEMGYRGYLLNRVADIGNRTRIADWVAVLYMAVLFGFGHVYKGPGGILDSAVSGFVLGLVYVLSGRNLWMCILAHGFSDSVAVFLVFFGLSP